MKKIKIFGAKTIISVFGVAGISVWMMKFSLTMLSLHNMSEDAQKLAEYYEQNEYKIYI